jgi:CBS domain containing-hemolysin-like protein
VQLGVNAWEIQGQLPLHDFSDLVGEPVEGEDVTTTSGWITQKLGGFPRRGDVVRLGAYDIQVEDADGRLVSRLTLKKRAGD